MLINTRYSNFELLRIVSMFLVLVVHASFKSIGIPSAMDIQHDLLSAFLRFTSESVSIICVNVFVLISGWFGIKLKLNRFCEFLFQILFYWILLFAIIKLFDKTQNRNPYDILSILSYDSYWFVRAYIILYIMSPMLNSFVDNSQKNDIKLFLVLFYTVQTLFGFIMNNSWFDNGYSPLSFIGLYILARYMRIYPCSYLEDRKYIIGTYFFSLLILIFASIFCSLYSFPYILKFYNYSSPIVLILSICFFYFFVGLKFDNKFVNGIAASCFSVYLLHTHPLLFDRYYLSIINYWFYAEPRFHFLLYTSSLIAFFFLISILIDKIRLFLWNRLCKIVKSFSIYFYGSR